MMARHDLRKKTTQAEAEAPRESRYEKTPVCLGFS